MPEIKELELESDEDRKLVIDFAKANGRYFSERGAELFMLIHQNEIDHAMQLFAVIITECFTSGMAEAQDRLTAPPNGED